MLTIAVIARKGGSGKTTVATHMAMASHLRGLRTLLADTDPQRSALEVLKARTGRGPSRTESSGSKLFALQVGARRDRFETLVIDTPSGSEAAMAHAIALADISLLIVRPTFLDLAAAVSTVEVVRRLGKPAMIVLNQAPVTRMGVEPPAMRQALQAVALLRTPVSPVTVRARAAYQTALASGRSAEETGADPVAADEMRALWRQIGRAVRRAAVAGAGNDLGLRGMPLALRPARTLEPLTTVS